MATPKKKQTKQPWQTVGKGNVVVPIHRRKKFHKATGKVYVVHEVADYTAGIRRLRSFNDPAKAEKGCSES